MSSLLSDMTSPLLNEAWRERELEGDELLLLLLLPLELPPAWAQFVANSIDWAERLFVSISLFVLEKKKKFLIRRIIQK